VASARAASAFRLAFPRLTLIADQLSDANARARWARNQLRQGACRARNGWLGARQARRRVHRQHRRRTTRAIRHRPVPTRAACPTTCGALRNRLAASCRPVCKEATDTLTRFALSVSHLGVFVAQATACDAVPSGWIWTAVVRLRTAGSTASYLRGNRAIAGVSRRASRSALVVSSSSVSWLMIRAYARVKCS
jgi:hypothetical protein